MCSQKNKRHRLQLNLKIQHNFKEKYLANYSLKFIFNKYKKSRFYFVKFRT